MKVSNVFSTLTLQQTFWKTNTFFKKLEYRFLVEATKIENTSFPFKTALSDTNFKTNSMGTTKWTYHKEWSFVNNYFIILENLFQFQNLLKELIWCTSNPNVHIRIFRKRWSLILGCFFPVSILNYINTATICYLIITSRFGGFCHFIDKKHVLIISLISLSVSDFFFACIYYLFTFRIKQWFF